MVFPAWAGHDYASSRGSARVSAVNVSTHGDATRREPSETGADDAAGDGLTRIEAEEHRRFLHLADARTRYAIQEARFEALRRGWR